MKTEIPSTFENFKQRQLTLGMETCSTTNYKGFEIFIRAYYLSGIKYVIRKKGDKNKLRGRHVNFCDPYKFLQHAKDWVDNYLATQE